MREAVRAKPGLILADIQLADGSSGLDAVNDILTSFEVPVVFVTAYPERLLTGEKPEPAFLLTKPFNDDTLKAVISQALFFDRKTHKAGGHRQTGGGGRTGLANSPGRGRDDQFCEAVLARRYARS